MDTNLQFKSDQLRVLIFKNNKTDLEWIKTHLSDLGYECKIKVTKKTDEYKCLLESFQPDVVISDFDLPGLTGLQALKTLRSKDDLTPFIFVSDTLGEENAVEATRLGATDFITRKRVKDFPAAILRAHREKEEKKANHELARQLKVNYLFVSALLQHDDWKKALTEAFHLIGDAFTVDRIYYFENSLDERTGEKFTSQRLEWTRGNIESQIDNPELQNLPFEVYMDFIRPLCQNRPFKAIVSELPHGALKDNLSQQDILSLLVLPIFISESFHGFIGFDDCTNERVWSEEAITFLETLSFNLAIAIEKWKAAVAVKESEQRLKTLISNIPGITYRCAADKKWTMLFVSDEIERMTGYPASDFTYNKKRTYASIIHPDDLDRTYSILDHLCEKKIFTLDYRLVCADGSLRWVEERGLGIYDDEDNLQYIDGVITDVTEKKKANNKFQAIFDQTTDAIFLADEKGRYVEFNKAAIKLFGYTRNELKSMNVAQLMGVPRDDNFTKRWNKFLKEGQEKGTLCLPVKHGGRITVSYNAVTNILPGTHLSIINDITEKVQKEAQLLASERKFKALVQEGSDLLSILDMEANYLFVSESSTKAMLGYSPEDLVGRNAFDFIHPEDKERVSKQFLTLKDAKQINISPFRFRDKSHRWRMIATTATNLLSDPAVQGIVANSRDVTDAILQKEALKVSNERFEIAMKATNEVIWDWDLRTDHVSRSKGFESIFGYHRSPTNHCQDFWMENIHEDDAEETRRSLAMAVQNMHQEKWTKEYRMVKADGSIAYLSDRAYIIRDGNGKAVRVVGAVSDISRSREMLHEISQQNKILKEIAWTQSHIVRAPLARLQGLVNLLKTEDADLSAKMEILESISASAAELDNIIRDIVKQAEQIER